MWPWTFGFRIAWLVNKSAGRPQFFFYTSARVPVPTSRAGTRELLESAHRTTQPAEGAQPVSLAARPGTELPGARWRLGELARHCRSCRLTAGPVGDNGPASPCPSSAPVSASAAAIEPSRADGGGGAAGDTGALLLLPPASALALVSRPRWSRRLRPPVPSLSGSRQGGSTRAAQ